MAANLVVEEALGQLNDIVAADGAVIRLVGSSEDHVELDLDLSGSSCPECVVPKAMLVDIVSARLAETAPDVRSVRLYDPREPA